MRRHEALDTGQPPAVKHSGRGSNRYPSESPQSAGCSLSHAAVQTECSCCWGTLDCQRGNLQPNAQMGACHTAQGSLPGRPCLLADMNMPVGNQAWADAAESPDWDLLDPQARAV